MTLTCICQFYLSIRIPGKMSTSGFTSPPHTDRLISYRIKLIGRLIACEYFIHALILYQHVQLHWNDNLSFIITLHSTVYCIFKKQNTLFSFNIYKTVQTPWILL